MKKTIIALVGVMVFLLAAIGVALAWPNQAPDRATMSGPGLKGEIEITELVSSTSPRSITIPIQRAAMDTFFGITALI